MNYSGSYSRRIRAPLAPPRAPRLFSRTGVRLNAQKDGGAAAAGERDSSPHTSGILLFRGCRDSGQRRLVPRGAQILAVGDGNTREPGGGNRRQAYNRRSSAGPQRPQATFEYRSAFALFRASQRANGKGSGLSSAALDRRENKLF